MKKAIIGATLALALIGTSSAALATSETGGISWYYGTGKTGAFGVVIPSDGAAHRTLAKGTRVLVKSNVNAKTTYVRIFDRGPFVTGRILDMTQESFSKLHATSVGVFNGTITY